MSTEEQTKYNNAFLWITSIAVSVLCCSVLFVLFASYLVELKADIKDSMFQINAMQQRENHILADLEALSKRLPRPPEAAIVTPPTDSATVAAPTDSAVVPSGAPAMAPTPSSPTPPSETMTAPSTTSAPSTVTVPVIQTPPSKP